MSGDVTPESLRALAEKALRRGYEFDADRRAEVAHDLRAAADRITELEAALAERDATIAVAPHGRGCPQGSALSSGVYPDTHAPDPCNCWKSAVPGDALTAHDAEMTARAVRYGLDERRRANAAIERLTLELSRARAQAAPPPTGNPSA